MKKGKVYYSGKWGSVDRFEYLCIHPKNPSYHILMDIKQAIPIRMYKDEFDQLRLTKRDAVQQAIHYHESKIETMKIRYAEILEN